MTSIVEVPASLNEHYRDLEARWRMRDNVSEYSALVVPTGNSEQPFHRWFHFKEGYSHLLVQTLIAESGSDPHQQNSIFDPFCGSGTTLLSGLTLMRKNGIGSRLQGVERNPVMQIVATAKLLGAAKGPALGDRVKAAQPLFWEVYNAEMSSESESLVSKSTTLNNENYFSALSVRSLLAMARSAKSAVDSEVSTVLQACVAACVEPSGYLRRDGRALRFQPSKAVRIPDDVFRSTLAKFLADMAQVEAPFEGQAQVALADARTFSNEGSEQYEWAIFSPPYPNNIDYTEVYKTEAWALELFGDVAEMKSQRLTTLRSHPSVRFPDRYEYESSDRAVEVSSLVSPILAAIPDDRYTRGRIQLVKGYVDDMLKVLANTRLKMSAGGRCAIVVGNSSHAHGPSQFVIAADLIIARLGELSGWEVDEIKVARRPTRRSNVDGWLRESIVMLRCVDA